MKKLFDYGIALFHVSSLVSHIHKHPKLYQETKTIYSCLDTMIQSEKNYIKSFIIRFGIAKTNRAIFLFLYQATIKISTNRLQNN
jgi:hypothetical protein